MLGELVNFIRLSFGKRMILYEIVVLSLTVYGTFPDLTIKLVGFSVCVITSGLFLPIFTSQFVSQLRVIIAHRSIPKIPISNEIANLAERMNVQVKELGLVKGCTAYVIGKCLVLGKELLERLTYDERQAVVAHELAHIRQRYIFWRIALTSPLLAIPLYSWWRISSPIFFTEWLTHIIITIMLFIGLLAYISMVMIPINWYLEVGADGTAARFAGKNNIKSALLNLVDKEKHEVQSETHPSISERVKRIEKLEF